MQTHLVKVKQLTTPFFLGDAARSDFVRELSAADKETLEHYMVEVERGAADGEMDIQSQEMGRGF